MNYHNITKSDMMNGEGLRVVLWVSGCNHKCEGCHNPQTWDHESGIQFDISAKEEIFKELSKDYISGITFSGGDPLMYENLPVVYDVVKYIKEKYPNKTIWLYTGYKLGINDFDSSVDICWDNALLRNHILAKCDVVCDGKFVKSLADVNYPWVGSTNQRIIDVKKTIENGEIVLYTNK